MHVHQDDIAAASFELGDAAVDQRPVGGQIIAVQQRIGADLPNHQFGVFGDDVAVEPGKLLGDVLAAFAAIDHPDVDAGEPVPERGLEPARIAQPRRARPGPLGRGRSHRNDRQRLALVDPGRDARLGGPDDHQGRGRGAVCRRALGLGVGSIRGVGGNRQHAEEREPGKTGHRTALRMIWASLRPMQS